MFKAVHNLMKLKVKIKLQTPLLVASGKVFDVTHPDIEFIRILTQHGETVYIPGSSIKGVLRSGLEAILGENEKWKSKICCTSEKMCHDLHRRDRDIKKKKVPYRLHCPVCRLFGSGDLSSRLEISDVFPYEFDAKDEVKKDKIDAIQKMVTSRAGIKIDRKTGKTSPGALFEYEILGGGELFAEFTLTNYELYQPGLLFMLFALSNDGFLRYGHSKSRGLGVLSFELQSVKILQMGQLKGKTIKGVGALKPGTPAQPPEEDYGFYMNRNGASDIIDDREFPFENLGLYTSFYSTDADIMKELEDMFKKKIDVFLGQL